MANSITLRKQYSTMLDLVYKKSSHPFWMVRVI